MLDCYRLAKYYGRSPREFLGMPASEVARHIFWTARLEMKLRENDGD